MTSRLPIALSLFLTACAGEISGTDPEASAPPDARAPEPDAAAPEPDAAPTAEADADAGPAAEPDAAPAAEPDASPEPMPEGCESLPGVLACEGFEGGAPDAALWTEDRRDATFELDGAHARSGARALHIRTAIAGSRGFLRLRADSGILPVEGNHFFGRMWVYGTDAPPTHGVFVRASGRLAGDYTEYRLDMNDGRLNSRYTNPLVPIHGGLRKLGYDLPAGEWLCVEWEYDGGANEMRYWMNGTAIDAMTVTSAEDPPWTAPVFEELRIGYTTFQDPIEPFDVWIDDVALGTERLGC